MPKAERVIVISDIHGNLELFKALLEKIQYTNKDILFLVGDLIEKGSSSLETLRYVMELAEKNTVYTVCGNCDGPWEDIKYGTDNEGLLRYMLWRKNSILNEMCREIGIKVNEGSDMKFIKKELMFNFKEELDWLEELPHIIETQSFIFAHAGITSEDLEEQEAYRVVKNDNFMNQGLTFSKYVIVGHWPTCNYGKEKGCCNPIINKEQRIISIDGGNEIKREGQLNALIFHDNDIDSITYAAVDALPKGAILEDQSANSNTINISWADNEIEVLEEGIEFSLCSHLSSNHTLLIKNTRIDKDKDKAFCYDCTDYFLEVKKGDIVSIIETASNQTLVKKDGTIGWVLNDKLAAL